MFPTYPKPGMSLRDYFAGNMNAFLSDREMMGVTGHADVGRCHSQEEIITETPMLTP